MYTYTYPHHGKEWEGGVLRKKYSPNLRFVVLESLSETEMQHILLHSGSTLLMLKIEQEGKLPTPTPVKNLTHLFSCKSVASQLLLHS